MMMAFTHTGEPGFCLYIPSEYALHVYDRFITVGFDYGIRDVGSLTQRFMRIEKFIPFWAEDLTRDTTPFEAGCNHVVKLDVCDHIYFKVLLMSLQHYFKIFHVPLFTERILHWKICITTSKRSRNYQKTRYVYIR
jgi:hypothetical protein